MKNPPVSGRIPCRRSVRERDFDAAARAVVGAYADCTPEPGDDQAAEVQADARPGFERIYLGETVEYPFLLVRGDAYAGVGYADAEFAGAVVLVQQTVTEPAAVNLAAFCNRLSITRVM